MHKTWAVLDLEGILKTSSFDWSHLTASQTVYAEGLHRYFPGEKLVFSQNNYPVSSCVTDGATAANVVESHIFVTL